MILWAVKYLHGWKSINYSFHTAALAYHLQIKYYFSFLNLIATICEMWQQHLAACLAASRFGQKLPQNTPGIKTKYGEIIAQVVTNISNLFLALFSWLETSSRPFYNLDKMAIFSTLRVKNQTHHNWFLTNCGKMVNWKGLDSELVPQNQAKFLLYYPWLHWLLDPVLPSNDLRVKRYIQKCTFPHALIHITTP